MATYTVNAGTVTGNTEAVGKALALVGSHAAPWGFTISSVAIGTGANAGKLQLNISITLTAAQLSHLGLV